VEVLTNLASHVHRDASYSYCKQIASSLRKQSGQKWHHLGETKYFQVLPDSKGNKAEGLTYLSINIDNSLPLVSAGKSN